MENESKPGHKGKVTVGANNVLGMGTWSWPGMSIEQLDDTEFGDDYTQFEWGLITSGTVAFNGYYKKDDTQGQDMLRTAFMLKSDLTDIRFYVDSVSYYTPNSTTAAGGGLPAGSPVSHINITGMSVEFDKGGSLGKVSFEGRISGAMRLI
ncbi:MAG: hypothetical protein ABIJ57_03355 [Pseudomonadota bacterium]